MYIYLCTCVTATSYCTLYVRKTDNKNIFFYFWGIRSLEIRREATIKLSGESNEYILNSIILYNFILERTRQNWINILRAIRKQTQYFSTIHETGRPDCHPFFSQFIYDVYKRITISLFVFDNNIIAKWNVYGTRVFRFNYNIYGNNGCSYNECSAMIL